MMMVGGDESLNLAARCKPGSNQLHTNNSSGLTKYSNAMSLLAAPNQQQLAARLQVKYLNQAPHYRPQPKPRHSLATTTTTSHNDKLPASLSDNCSFDSTNNSALELQESSSQISSSVNQSPISQHRCKLLAQTATATSTTTKPQSSATVTAKISAPPTSLSSSVNHFAAYFQQRGREDQQTCQFKRNPLRATLSIEEQIKQLLELNSTSIDNPDRHSTDERETKRTERAAGMKKAESGSKQFGAGKNEQSLGNRKYQQSSGVSPDDRFMLFMMASRSASTNSTVERSARIFKWMHNCSSERQRS